MTDKIELPESSKKALRNDYFKLKLKEVTQQAALSKTQAQIAQILNVLGEVPTAAPKATDGGAANE